uniref:transglutaminase-like cysteine peptidase n=1 Tax=uncultured Altererythrobacter sp. TaxID=500840 RepID=UPI00261E8294|nr:transglutaminase-like cysteine peptidase [uncultured Altererythrobacter sp.]
MFRNALFAAKVTGGLLAGVAALPAVASAPLSVTVPSAMPLAAVGISEAACTPTAAPAYGATVSSQAAKTAAIMGGQMSALERMKAAQSGQAAPVAAVAPTQAITQSITPANRAACGMLGVRQTANLAVYPQSRETGRFLGTERVRIGRTRFDASWDRVSDRELSRRDMRRSIGYAPRNRSELLTKVNSWVNRNITYRDDRVQYGMSDYWADARTTLRSGAGDCEDYAILKMQMLAAAGVDREDMMLTLARDTVQRIDHAVLLVKNGGEWVMLDMASDRIAPAGMSYGYRPVMSFAANERFLHGRAYQAPTEQPQRPVRFASN